MKILHLRASNFYGGPERQIHIHAQLLRGSDFDMTIGSFSENGQAPEFLKVISDDGLKIHLFEVKSSYDMAAIAKLRNYLIENGIDILCTHDYRTHVIGFRAVKKTGAKWVAFSRGWTRDTARVRLYQLIDKIIIRFADRIVAVSKAQKDKLVRLMMPSAKISVVHNAVDPDSMTAIQAVDLRKRFHFPDEAVIALTGGRFSREKGQIFLLDAAAEAVAANPRLRFLLFGDGPDLNLIRKKVARLKLEEFIFCPGFEKDLLSCLKGSDFLINPSLSEGLPNIVLEAMALGVPVLATSVGGVPELIEDGKSGLLVSARDEGALKEAIVKLAGSPELGRSLSRSAGEILRESFSFEKQAIRLKEIYSGVVSRTANGGGP